MKGIQRLMLSAHWGELIAEVFAALEKPLQQVEEFLRQAVQSSVRDITAMALHLLSAGGKRLRPALTLLSAQFVGGITPRAIAFAAVVELMHTATLIHDDVIDKAEVRRGRDAVHRLWGNEAAIMCGDHLYARAFSILAEDGDIQVIRTMAEASSRVCEGEILELQLAFNPDITYEQCLEVARLKTAELIAAACKIGALSGGGSPVAAEALESYGRHLGIAFQIVDDLLDWEGSAEEVGKPVGSDLLEGKITLPVWHTLAALPVDQRACWRQRIAQRAITPADIHHLAHHARRLGVFETVRQIADAYAQKAIATLRTVSPDGTNWAQRLLEQAAHFVVRRRA
ncbi:Octaprenyl diphosphate synthase [bacterium HR17]|jgi:octaprenyl-diphosphate synthase|uniref:Octaprenyl diphosphate synthase n=1 Tax=Candidatus Fervidibacter japonicus TaxID=2035412 RepID=A0A2H5X8P7_9BACT|nr:Octaprenyl diphosphate synthase [bacterium HR17]